MIDRRRLLIGLVVAAAYIASGRIGLSLAFVNESTTAIWPPAGIAVAALLLLGSRVWPAVAIGAFAVNMLTSQHLAGSFVIAAGNTAEALAAAWLARRFARGRDAFGNTGDILRFVAGSALGATTIAASVGTGALVSLGLAMPGDAGSVWLTWWLGDAAGIVMFTPLIVSWASPGRAPWTRARAVEALVLLAAVTLTAWVVFQGPIGARHLQLQFFTIPLLLWAAFRFGGRETATCAALVSVFAIRGTSDGLGPFAGGSPNQSLLIVQGFIGVITMVMLAVAAEVSNRWRAERDMRALNEALEERVAARTEELTRVRDRLVEAQQVARIGSWEWDVATGDVWWSSELYSLYGVPVDAPVTYGTFLGLVHPEDRTQVEAVVATSVESGEPFAFDHRIVRPDGAVRVLHGNGRAVRDQAGRVVRMVGTGHDITAEAASRAKDQFLAVLSHELRTPLNVALGWTHLLRDDPGLESRARRIVDTVHRNLQLLTRLVSDIMDVSRIAAGALTLDVRPVDLGDLAHAAVETVRRDAAARSITVRTEISPSLPAIRGDGDRLQQVIWNLLSNAVKFARPGGQITLRASPDDDAVRIVVEDDGPGIAPEFLPHVFEQFRQGDSSMTREHGGLGLGLAIARRLVQLHGGTIAAANREQGGAVFTVRLPVETSGVIYEETPTPDSQ